MNHYDKLRELVEIDSPTGFTAHACKYIFDYFKSLGYKPEYTNKGAVKCALGENPTLAMLRLPRCAHYLLPAPESGFLSRAHP